MAEAIALLGVVAAATQFIEVGSRVLRFGSSLSSKLGESSQRIERWLDQVRQFSALVELIKQKTTPLSPLAASATSELTTPTWLETTLRICTAQTLTLEEVLEDMRQDVYDGMREKVRKRVLTLKREERITQIMNELERHKSTLSIWLGQKNLHHLESLHSGLNKLREAVGNTNDKTFQNGQNLDRQLGHLVEAVHKSSDATASHLEKVKTFSEHILVKHGQEIRQLKGRLESGSSATQRELSALVGLLKTETHF